MADADRIAEHVQSLIEAGIDYVIAYIPGVAYDLPKGDTLELQVSTSTDSFAPNRAPSVVQLSGTVTVPVLAAEG